MGTMRLSVLDGGEAQRRTTLPGSLTARGTWPPRPTECTSLASFSDVAVETCAKRTGPPRAQARLEAVLPPASSCSASSVRRKQKGRGVLPLSPAPATTVTPRQFINREWFSMSSPSVHRSLPPTQRCSSDDQDYTRYPLSHKPH